MSLDLDGRGADQPTPSADPLVRRAWLAATDDPVLDLQVQGKALVAALIDQLAAGQVETLHSLHTAAATVRRQTAELQGAVVGPVQQIDALLADLRVLQSSLHSNAVGVMGEVTTQLDGVASDRLAEMRAALALPVRPLTELLSSLQAVHETLQVSASTVVDGVTARLGGQLDALVASRVDQVNQATAAPLAPLLALTDDLSTLWSSLEGTAGTIVAGVTTALDGVTARLGGQLDALVASRVDQVNQATAVPLEPLLALADDLSTLQVSLEGTAGTIVAGVTTALDARIEAMIDQRLSRASEELTANASVLTTVIATAVASAVEQLAQATDELDAATSRAEQGAQQSEAAAEVAFSGFIDTLVEAGMETLEGIEHAGKSLLTRLDTRVEDFLATLMQRLDRQATRDDQVEVELSDRVRQLVDRTDIGVRRLSDRLRKETDRLAQRDEEQEHLRADSFVNALETLLAQPDAPSALRSRIMDVLGSERRKSDEPRAAALPAGRPVADEVAEDGVAVAPPVRVRPVPVVRPVAVEPTAVKPAAVKPAARKPAASKPAAVKPAARKPAVVKPAATRAPARVRAVAARKAPVPPVVARTARPRPSAPSKQETTS